MLAKVQAQMNDTEKNPRDGEPGGCRLWGRTESDMTEAT